MGFPLTLKRKVEGVPFIDNLLKDMILMPRYSLLLFSFFLPGFSFLTSYSDW